MSVWTDFENWRDEIHCGGEPEKEHIEAEIGAKYELYDAIYDRVEKTVTCTQKNKLEIERSLNDDTNDIWWWRKEDKEMVYEVNYTDAATGATSPIEVITAIKGYTAEDYIRDCKDNADDEWNEMLANGTVQLIVVMD